MKSDCDDIELLQEYAEGDRELAFRVVVERYLDLVYGTALRQVRDHHLAEDVAQNVFTLLAAKAERLGGKTILAGWLYRTTRFVAANMLRSELRRRKHEEESALMPCTPHESDSEKEREATALLVDEELSRLARQDREALVLRFFARKQFRDVASLLGITEEAAKKRVARVLERLGQRARRGKLPLPSRRLPPQWSHKTPPSPTAARLPSNPQLPRQRFSSILATNLSAQYCAHCCGSIKR